jgi:hypothetical protein
VQLTRPEMNGHEVQHEVRVVTTRDDPIEAQEGRGSEEEGCTKKGGHEVCARRSICNKGGVSGSEGSEA